MPGWSGPEPRTTKLKANLHPYMNFITLTCCWLMYLLAHSEGTRNGAAFWWRRLRTLLLSTTKHCESSLLSGGLKKVMAFVLLYVQGKMLEEKRKKCSFQAAMLRLQFIVYNLKEEFPVPTCLTRNGLVKDFKGTSEMQNVACPWNGPERKRPWGSMAQIFHAAWTE